MLTEICQYLHNWFCRKPDGSDYPKEAGNFTIENGELKTEILANGQYFRIMGSLFNDGVHKYGTDESGETPVPFEPLTDETFTGEVWSMGVPAEIVALDAEIVAWQAKYGTADNPAMSPFTNESFGGYSYTKPGSSDGATAAGWQAVFAKRLNPWRKI